MSAKQEFAMVCFGLLVLGVVLVFLIGTMKEMHTADLKLQERMLIISTANGTFYYYVKEPLNMTKTGVIPL